MRTGRLLTVYRSLLPGMRCLLRGGGIPACTEADPPAVNRITDTSKNIALVTTSLRPVKSYDKFDNTPTNGKSNFLLLATFW